MIRRTLAIIFLFVTLAIGFSTGTPATGAPPSKNAPPSVPGQIIVKLKQPLNSDSAQQLFSAQGLAVEDYLPQLNVHTLRVIPGQEAQKITELSNNPLVEYAEPDYLYTTDTVIPDDPGYPSQWNLPKIHALEAWNITTGISPSVLITVAIVDTGVYLSHPDFTGRLLPGETFVPDTTTPNDDNGHGTHVAGIVAANANNLTGTVGISWGAKIMPVKVLDARGIGLSSGVANGIIYAADNGARIINMSLGGTGYSQTMLNAINYAISKNVLVVVAMGNSGNPNTYTNPTVYPAAYPGVLSVAASDSSDTRATFSSYNDYASVSAPGVGIFSTVPYAETEISDPTGYASLNGTSMATPHVSGLAALVLSIHPEYTYSQVKGVIEQSAVDLGARGWDQYYGWGRIDAYQVLIAAAPVTGIKGRVVDPAGNSISGAIVTAGGIQTNTDTNGDFQVTLPPGTYDIAASHPTFGNMPTVHSITVRSGELSPSNVVLPSRINAVANNGFEDGTLSYWNISGDYTPAIATTLKHSGSYSAFLGVPNLGYTEVISGNSTISQSVGIPGPEWSSQPTLSFNYRLVTTDGPGYDSFSAVIKSSTGITLATPLITDQGGGWHYVSYDLNPWAGQQLIMQFSVWNDESLTTGVYLDEVNVGPLSDILSQSTYCPSVQH